MLVTVVRNKLGDVVELPDGVNIRPFNFVELKELSPAMKEALVLLEKAGSVNVAQVADVSHVMMEGSVENRMPSDTVGQVALGTPFISDADRKAALERLEGMPDVLTDYSKSHALSADELASRKSDLEERVARGANTGDGMPVMRVVAVSKEDMDAENKAIKRPAAGATTVDAAKDKLSDTQIDQAKQAVKDVTIDGSAPSHGKARKKAEAPQS